MKKILAVSILLLFASVCLGQDDSKIETNSFIFKHFEQKNGFCRTGVSFNYFLYSIGFSFDFFINGRLSIDAAFDGVFSYDKYYSGQSFGVKFWPKKIRSTSKLYPFVGLGYSNVKSSKYIIKKGNNLELPIGARYLFRSGFQVTYHLNFGPLITDNDFYSTLTCFTFGVGWRF